MVVAELLILVLVVQLILTFFILKEVRAVKWQLGHVLSFLHDIKKLLSKSTANVLVRTYVIGDQTFISTTGDPMPLQMTDVQSVSASIGEVDAAGNPVPVDPSNLPVWAVSDPSILVLTSNPDGTATIKAAGPLGAAQVSVTAGGLNAQDTITVVASAATALTINFGTPA